MIKKKEYVPIITISKRTIPVNYSKTQFHYIMQKRTITCVDDIGK